MKQLLRTLYSACRILEQLDTGDVQSLRDSPQYTARLEQLMAPMDHSIASKIQEGQAASLRKAVRPGHDGEPQPRHASIKCTFISSDRMRKSKSHSKNTVVSRWLPLVTPKASSPSEPQSISTSKNIRKKNEPVAKHHRASDSKRATPVSRSLPEPAYTSTSEVSPVKLLDSSDVPTHLDLTQQYEIIQTLLSRPNVWSNVGSSDPPTMAYLVSNYWWDWFGKTYLHAKDPAVKALGIKYSMEPVDNRSLLATRPGLNTLDDTLSQPRLAIGALICKSKHFICVRREVWESCLVEW